MELNVGGDLHAGNLVLGNMVNIPSTLTNKRLVIVESPYAGDAATIEANVEYARDAVRDSLLRGEAPIASHILYTQPGILDDTIPTERQLGIDAGLAWRDVAAASVVYVDRGISRGMEYGIKRAHEQGIPVEYRRIFSSRHYYHDLLHGEPVTVPVAA